MKHATPSVLSVDCVDMDRSQVETYQESHPKSQSEVLELYPIRDTGFREWFAPAFSKWLKQNFSSPEQVAQVFSVRASTAWNWWNGDNRASGDAVCRAFLTYPDAVSWFIQEWNSR